MGDVADNQRASPHYGSTTSTPRQINSHVTNPPPLDIGEPHVHPSHPIAASAPVPRSPFLDPEAPRRRKPERTVTFSAQQSPSERPSAIPADEEVRQTDRTSSEDGLHPPGSDVPLNESAGPSRWATQSSTPRSTPRLKVSPGVLNTNIDFSAIRTPRSPKTGISPMTRGQRSFRELLVWAHGTLFLLQALSPFLRHASRRDSLRPLRACTIVSRRTKKPFSIFSTTSSTRWNRSTLPERRKPPDGIMSYGVSCRSSRSIGRYTTRSIRMERWTGS